MKKKQIGLAILFYSLFLTQVVLAQNRGNDSSIRTQLPKIDSVKFPESFAINAIQNEPNFAKKEAIANAYFSMHNKGSEGIYTNLALAYAEQKDINAAKLQGFIDKMYPQPIYKFLIAGYLFENGEPALAAMYSKQLLDVTKPFDGHMWNDSGLTNQERSNIRYAHDERMDYLTLLSKALYMQKKYSEALPYTKEAFENSNKRFDDSIRACYINILIKLNKYSEAFPVMEEGLRLGKESQAWRSYFNRSYIAAKGSAAGYGTLLDAIKRDSIKNSQGLLFSWTDLNGKPVSLKDYKGKVIVLDFWATWCVPCVQSFPMMRDIQNKYRKDPNVVFLFIATREIGVNPVEDVKRFMKDKQYEDFRMLVDRKTSDVGYQIRDLYHVISIPEKIILDGNGKIAFRKVGFTEEQKEREQKELMQMIEDAKKYNYALKYIGPS
jgi:thiol-disulfide isomerase/thioredoxin